MQGDNYGASNVQENDLGFCCVCGGGCIAFVPSSSIGLDAHTRTKRAAPLTAHHFSDCGKQRPDIILGCNRPEWFLTWVQCLKWSDAQENEKAYFPRVSLWFSPDLHIDQWGKVLTSTKVNFLDDGLRSAKISSSDGTGNFMSFSEFKVYGYCLELSIWYLCGSSPASETNNTIDELRKSLAACCLCNKFPPSTNSLIWAFSRTQLICKNRWLIHKCSIKIHTWLPRQHCLKNKWGDKWVYSQSS